MNDQVLPSGKQPNFWGRYRSAILSGVFAAVIAVSAGVYIAWQDQRPTSPAAALTGMASSAIQGDFLSVAASIDTTSVVDSAIDDVLSETSETRSAVFTEYLKGHPETTPELIKMKARKTLDEEIREHIRSGTLPKKIPLGNSTLKALIAEAMANKSIRSVKIDGGIAHVVAKVPYRGRALTVKIRMRRSGDTWKVDRIENMASVLKQAGY